MQTTTSETGVAEDAKESKEQSGSDLLPVYLFNGDDELKRETLVKRLLERFSVLGDSDMNVQVFRAESLKEAAALLDALNTLPFASPLRLVIVRDADKLSKELSEALISYLKAPCLSTVLALSAEKLALNSRLYKAISAFNAKSVIDASGKKRSELPQLVAQIAARNGLKMSQEAAAALIDRIGISTVSLDNEVVRLSAWAQGAGKTEITVGDIVEQVQSLTEIKPWELADALMRRDAEKLLRMLALSPGISATAVFTQCVSRLRDLLSIKTLKRRGHQSSTQIAAYLGRQEWQLRATIQAAENFTSKELVGRLREAPRIEAALKSGADVESLLVTWLISVCAGKTLPEEI